MWWCFCQRFSRSLNLTIFSDFMTQMFSPPSGQAQPSNDLKRHCILITASNPHILPTPVYRPRLQNVERNENGDAQAESRLSDAETVASYFAKVLFLTDSPRYYN
jgi:hypothetical protein